MEIKKWGIFIENLVAYFLVSLESESLLEN